MEKIFAVIGVVFVLSLVVAGIFSLPNINLVKADSLAASPDGTDASKEDMRTITVSGSSELSLQPEKLEVYISVVTDSLKARDSQSKNAEVSAKVLATLQAAGVAKTSIETVSYSLSENREWDDSARKYKSTGYRTSNSFKISSASIGDAGKIIDAATDAGANQVDNIVFSLSDAKIKELKLQALSLAAKQTMEKADTIALGVGVKVKQLETISEQQTYYYPVYKSFGLGEAARAPDAAPTEIIAGQIKVTALVNAVYSIE